jgi:hypothetical protein
MLSSSDIINQKFSEGNLRTYFVGFDLGEYRNDSFTEILMDIVVDFAFGYHTGILKLYDRRKLIEAARSIYKIREYSEAKKIYVDQDAELSDCELTADKKYLKRGEFGEMILHLLLRDFFGTVPLMSKIHFKDADGATVHGFDIVHIGPDLKEDKSDSIFLGESKIYSRKNGDAGKQGINDLIEDVKEHFKKDFLYREFALIIKKKDSFVPLEEYSDANTKDEYEKFLERKNYWFNTLTEVESRKHKLQDFFKSVTIPLLCTYQSQIFNDCTDESSPEFIAEFEKEVNKLKECFDERMENIENEIGEPVKTNLNIILLLFPIPSKKQLIKLLHQKLYNQQNS